MKKFSQLSKRMLSLIMSATLGISMMCVSGQTLSAKKTVKVKKITITSVKKSKLTLAVGKKHTIKVKVYPKKATNKKLKYSTSDKKIATVSKKGVITAKKKGSAKITIKATDKSKKKAVLKLTVTDPSANNSNNQNTASNTNAVNTNTNAVNTNTNVINTNNISPTAASANITPEPNHSNDNLPDGTFTVAAGNNAAPIYIDVNKPDYDGLKLVADCFSDDLELVTGTWTDVVTDVNALKGDVIVVGSIGSNSFIDKLINDGKINVDNVKGKWEVFRFDVVENPANGIDRALVITGSDKRGAIYGLFTLSEMMGVSPWVYWADVLPEHKDTVSFKYSELRRTSKEPSVKYRGIFLNDEEPALGTWVQKKFKKEKGSKFNEFFYEKVFQLLLRLKANYMWPAMWNSAFGAGGYEFPEKSAELADQYGIVMGTSHHEPMMLAHEEWNSYKKDYGNEWNFATNEEGLTRFFEYGADHYGKYDNLCTIGMRGDGDATMLPEGSSVEENVSLLKKIITTQKNILADKELSDKPTMLALYKEVEEYWYGDSSTPGLREWGGQDAKRLGRPNVHWPGATMNWGAEQLQIIF